MLGPVEESNDLQGQGRTEGPAPSIERYVTVPPLRSGIVLKCKIRRFATQQIPDQGGDNRRAADRTKAYTGSPQCTANGNAGTMARVLKRVATMALGWAFVLGGIAGLLLPILPGGILIAAGLLMLSPHYPWIRQATEKYRARYHVLDRTVTWLDELGTSVDRARLAAVVAIRTHFPGIK